MMSYDIETKCLHIENKEDSCDRSGAISFPIYQTATFAHPGLESSTGYDYSRLQNPTREQLEKVVAGLEDGVDAVAFSSGMAAVEKLASAFGEFDVLLKSDYEAAKAYVNNIAVKEGNEF